MTARRDPGPRDPPFRLVDDVEARRAFEACRKGDHDACRRLMAFVDRFRRTAVAGLVKLGVTYHDAEDAVADAIAALYEQALAGEWRRAPRNWARALAWKARTCLFKTRKGLRPCRRALRALRRGDAIVLPPVESEVRRAFEQLLAPLTARERQVVMARLSGQTYAAIAELQGTTAGAVRQQFMNAKRKLRDRFGRGPSAKEAA